MAGNVQPVTDWQQLRGDPPAPGQPGPLAPIPGPSGLDAALRLGAPGDINFHLLFHRYLPPLPKKDKTAFLLFLRRAYAQWAAAQAPLLAEMRSQNGRAVAGVTRDGRALEITIELRERLVIGAGIPSPLETGLRLHHLAGVPYLPASTLKGLARAVALQAIGDRYGVASPGRTFDRLLLWAAPEQATKDVEAVALHGLRRLLAVLSPNGGAPPNPHLTVAAWPAESVLPEVACYRRIFGGIDGRGSVIIGDALPVQLGSLDVDVVNRHYGDYYEHPATVPPGDYMEPLPSFFLAVPPGARFRLPLGLLDRSATTAGTADPRERVADWLAQGLPLWGIGAKKAAGYGAAAVVTRAWVSRATPAAP